MLEEVERLLRVDLNKIKDTLITENTIIRLDQNAEQMIDEFLTKVQTDVNL